MFSFVKLRTAPDESNEYTNEPGLRRSEKILRPFFSFGCETMICLVLFELEEEEEKWRKSLKGAEVDFVSVGFAAEEEERDE